MARRLKLEIAESAEYLEKSLKQARSASQKERLQMLWWLKSGQVHEHQELSKRLPGLSQWSAAHALGNRSPYGFLQPSNE